MSANSEGQSASSVPLDPIKVAGHADMARLKAASVYFVFAALALSWCTDPNAFSKLIDTELYESERFRRRITAPQWGDHIASLKDYNILVEEDLIHLKFVSSYFGVFKTAKDARAILNGRRLSHCTTPPPPVNLPYLPDVIRKSALLLQKYKANLRVCIGDWRHFFHQISVHKDISAYFGLMLRKANGSCQSFRWATLPMGHSHSPFIAQCIGWTILLHEEPGDEALFDDADLARIKTLKEPPQFVKLRCGGFVTLFYDNFKAVGPSAGRMHDRIVRNCSSDFFNIAIKELELLDGTALIDKGYDYLGAHLQARKDIHGDYTLWCSQCAKRLTSWKDATISADLSRLTAIGKGSLSCSVRQVASIIGKIIWRDTLSFTPKVECYAVIDILRRLPRDDWDRIINLSEKDSGTLAECWQDVLRNVPHNCFEECPEVSRTYWLCTDSSDHRFGSIGYDCTGHVIHERGGDWIPYWRREHIFVKEARAAHDALTRLLKKIDAPSVIVIGIDNSAVVASLRRGFSSNQKVNLFYQELFRKLREKKCILQVVGLPTELNAADPASRKKICSPLLADNCWIALNDASQGLRYCGPDMTPWHRSVNLTTGAEIRHATPLDLETAVDAEQCVDKELDVLSLLIDDVDG